MKVSSFFVFLRPSLSFSTSWMKSGRGRFLVSGRRRTASPERMGKTPYMIQGRWGEYTVRIIKRGAMAAPKLEAIPRIPVAVALIMVGISSFPWAEELMRAAEETPTPKVDKVTRRVCISSGRNVVVRMKIPSKNPKIIWLTRRPI